MKKRTEDIIAPKKPTTNPRILFMGTSLFAKIILTALVENNYNIIAVYAQPDKKSGRKNKVEIGPVKKYCLKNNLTFYQPDKLNDEERLRIKELDPDLIVVAAYGKILSQDILDIPGFGNLNVHASLLPKYRGASPIQNALLAGDKKTGTTIMLMDKNIDTGDILAQAEIEIGDDDTTETLSQKLAKSGVEQVLNIIPPWINGNITPKKQDDHQSIPCQLIKRSDGHILWNERAADIYNKFRAFYPWPGVFSFWNKKGTVLRLKLRNISLKIDNDNPQHSPGQVFSKDGGIFVQAASGLIALEEVQLEGKSPITIRDFINGHSDFIGSKLE